MPKENLEIVRAIYAEAAEGRFGSTLHLFHPDVEYSRNPSGERGHAVGLSGTAHGVEAMAKASLEWVQTFDRLRVKADRFIEAGDSVVVLTRHTGNAKASGLPIQGAFADVLTLDEGRVVRFAQYRDRAAALKAAGLSEEAGSEENVEIVRKIYAAWEWDAFKVLDDEALDLLDLDPEIEWDASRRTFDPGLYHGYDGIRAMAAGLREVWESGRIEPLEFIQLGKVVVVPVRLVVVSRTDRQALAANAAHIWTLRDGRVIRHCGFQTKADALEAAGLSE